MRKLLRKKFIANYIKDFIYVLLGVLCVFFTEYIVAPLPFIIGGFLILGSLLTIINYMVNKSYKDKENYEFIQAIVNLAVGLVFLFSYEFALTIFAFVWGVAGIYKGADCLHKVLHYISIKQKFLLELIEAIIEFTLGILLFIEFAHGLGNHIILLGFYLLITGVFSIFGISKEDAIEEKILSAEKMKKVLLTKNNSIKFNLDNDNESDIEENNSKTVESSDIVNENCSNESVVEKENNSKNNKNKNHKIKSKANESKEKTKNNK
ncbi:MAG: DUF308 domain-containing protein [Christensenellales bacterium]